MTVAPLGAPGGRVLAGWWRQLAPYSPRGLWLADWLLHRVEVLTRRIEPAPLEPLPRLLLEFLSDCELPAAELSRRLGLSSGMLHTELRNLASAGLVEAYANDLWAATDASRAARRDGIVARPVYQRESFCVLDSPSAILPLYAAGAPLTPPDDWRLPLDALRRCVDRPEEWKRRVGFPRETDAILGVNDAADVPAWRRVPVDRAERLLAAIIRTADDLLLAFVVKPEIWTLVPEPILQLPFDDAAELLQLAEPGAQAWREAWREWCRSVRGATAAEIESAPLNRVEERLTVRAGPALMEKLKAQPGDAWLLAGGPRHFTAARLEFSE